MNKTIKHKSFYLVSCFLLVSIFLFWFLRKTSIKQIDITKIESPTVKQIVDLSKQKSNVNLSAENISINQVYFSMKNVGHDSVIPNLNLSKKNWFSNEEILDEAFKVLPSDASDKQKSIALFEFVSENTEHFEPPFYKSNFQIVASPVQLLNVWGYGYCSDISNVLAQLNTMAGVEARVVQLNNHMAMESFFDDKWHFFDPDIGVYINNQDGIIASAEDIYFDKSLLSQVKNKLNLSDSTYKLLRDWYDVAFINEPTNYFYKDVFLLESMKENMGYHLMPGEEIRFYNNWDDSFFWEFSDKKPPFTNGILISGDHKFRKIFLYENFDTYLYSLPFPIVKAYFIFDKGCGNIPDFTVSSDGVNWEEVDIDNCSDGKVIVGMNFFKVGNGTMPVHRYYVKFPKGFKDFSVISQFQASRKSVPIYSEISNLDELKEYANTNQLKLEFGLN